MPGEQIEHGKRLTLFHYVLVPIFITSKPANLLFSRVTRICQRRELCTREHAVRPLSNSPGIILHCLEAVEANHPKPDRVHFGPGRFNHADVERLFRGAPRGNLLRPQGENRCVGSLLSSTGNVRKRLFRLLEALCRVNKHRVTSSLSRESLKSSRLR